MVYAANYQFFDDLRGRNLVNSFGDNGFKNILMTENF